MIRVNSRYDRVWVVGRTYLRGPRISATCTGSRIEYSITPLSKFGTAYKPPRPRKIITKSTAGDDSRHPAGRGPARVLYGARQGDAEVPGAGSRSSRCSRSSGRSASAPGSVPRTRTSAPTRSAACATRSRKGPNKVLSGALALYLQGFARHNGYLVTDLGAWGTNYTLRAIGDRLGVGGQRASIATYPVALFDDTKAPLTGSKRYVVHIPKSSLPIPVKAFWSLTMYDTNSFFVPNPLNRYLINNRSHLHTQPRRLDRHLHTARPAVEPDAGEQLAARARAADSGSAWSGACMTSTTRSSACSTARAGSPRLSSRATPPATSPTGPPARPSRRLAPYLPPPVDGPPRRAVTCSRASREAEPASARLQARDTSIGLASDEHSV